MNSLLDPLDEPQTLLVDTVCTKFVQGRQFPKYQYVEYVMRRAGHNAEAVLRSFPIVGRHLRSDGYSAVGWSHTGGAIPSESPVWLTLAGLHGIGEDVPVGVTRALLAYMRELTKAQEQILEHPFQVLNLNMDLREFVERLGHGTMYLPWATAVSQHEWPGISFSHRPGTDTGTGTLGYLVQADFHTTDDYLTAVTAALTPPSRQAALPYLEPRALVRALSFLDVTYELVVGSPLVERPAVDRSSLLVLPAQTEAEFTAGVTVLSELLGNLNVPKTKKQPPHALARLEQHLVDSLPAIDQPAVNAAVHTLDQIRVLRNSSVHPKPDIALLQAHEELGLTFPITDYASSWDNLRARPVQPSGRDRRHPPVVTRPHRFPNEGSRPGHQMVAGPAAAVSGLLQGQGDARGQRGELEAAQSGEPRLLADRAAQELVGCDQRAHGHECLLLLRHVLHLPSPVAVLVTDHGPTRH